MATYDDKLLLMNPYIRYVNCVPGDSMTYSVPWRVLYDFEIIYIIEGELIVSEVGKNYTLQKNDFHIMPPNIKHKRFIDIGKTVKYYNVHLDLFSDINSIEIDVNDVYIKPCLLKLKEVDIIEKLVKKIPNQQNVDLARKIKIIDNERMTADFEKLLRMYRGDFSVKQLILKSIIMKIFFQIFNQNPSENSTSEHIITIEKFTNQIFENENINIKMNVSQYGFSPQYFRKLFKMEYNVSPKKYLTLKKLDKAKGLLEKSHHNISEISIMSGYDNVYYFSRLFKKYVGVSPKIYRENHREASENNND